jgi:hypothetical protein
MDHWSIDTGLATYIGIDTCTPIARRALFRAPRSRTPNVMSQVPSSKLGGWARGRGFADVSDASARRPAAVGGRSRSNVIEEAPRWKHHAQSHAQSWCSCDRFISSVNFLIWKILSSTALSCLACCSRMLSYTAAACRQAPRSQGGFEPRCTIQ